MKTKNKETTWRAFWLSILLMAVGVIMVMTVSFFSSLFDLKEAGEAIEFCISIERQ